MSIEKVRKYFKTQGLEEQIREFSVSSATVELAALALNVAPGRIAKTLSFQDKEGGCILVVTTGDVKIDNSKFKRKFGMKAKMLAPMEVADMVGHAVGGVCPFALPEGVNVYLDESLKKYDTIFPACGSSNSAIELKWSELEKYVEKCQWVDVTKEM
ncbi:YbaK/EbsC family protein [Fusobacterium sp. PH5-44]|uniref:YbaK/EbsC family protein n=1 Tax=unclassified Fusobacterium TaxID=2648384 RepID=UPI003D208700